MNALRDTQCVLNPINQQLLVLFHVRFRFGAAVSSPYICKLLRCQATILHDIHRYNIIKLIVLDKGSKDSIGTDRLSC